jgi:hypothetical protein
MMRQHWGGLVIAIWLVALSACEGPIFQDSKQRPNGAQTPADRSEADKPIGAPLFTPAAVSENLAATTPGAIAPVDPVVIPDARLEVFRKADVPSMRDGVILFVGTPMKPGEKARPGRETRTVRFGKEDVLLMQLKEDDEVEGDQLLAILDNRLATDDWQIKENKITQAKAEKEAAVKTRDEAYQRYLTMQQLWKSNRASYVVSQEDVRGAELTYQKTNYDAVSKKEAIGVAELECNQARTVLELHQIKSPIAGIIKSIYRKTGESVRTNTGDPLFQIHNLDRLRVEGQLDVPFASNKLRKGMKAIVEPSFPKPPVRVLLGHLQGVNAVTIGSMKTRRPGDKETGREEEDKETRRGGDKETGREEEDKETRRGGDKETEELVIVSGSEDGTIRGWDRRGGRERFILRHPREAAIRAVACTPPGAETNLCVAGASDGSVQIWDLNSSAKKPLKDIRDHRAAVGCVAFSPDGRWLVTGGDDRQIILYDASTGEKRYAFEGHRAGITSLHITPRCQLLSAGKDYTFCLWELGEQGARKLRTAKLDHRSGDVAQVNVSPDGSRVLFDTGKTLRVLSLPKGLTEGVLQNPTGAANFARFALFSPDGQLILTTGASEGRLQLWKAPTPTQRRGHEVRQWVSNGSTFTCAAFAPDGSFAVTGTEDRHVLVWSVPPPEELDRQITAELTLVERAVESGGNQVRIWAEFDNPRGPTRLLPGTPVTLVIPPTQPQF